MKDKDKCYGCIISVQDNYNRKLVGKHAVNYRFIDKSADFMIGVRRLMRTQLAAKVSIYVPYIC